MPVINNDHKIIVNLETLSEFRRVFISYEKLRHAVMGGR